MNESAKKQLTLVLMAATTLPFFFIVNTPPSWSLSSENLDSIALYLGSALGYIGVALLLWQFALGTRSITGLIFNDLPWAIRLHTKIGIFGSLLIFLHPLLILYNYGESLAYLFIPNLSDEFEKHVTFGRFAFLALLIVWVSSAILREKIAYRPWKRIHWLAYPSIFFAFIHANDIGSSMGNQLVKILWTMFIIDFIAFGALRLRHVFGIGRPKYKIVGYEQITDDIVKLRMKTPASTKPVTLGQYIYIQTKLFGEQHPFTVLASDHKNGEVSIAYKTFGKFTQDLNKLKPGDSVRLDGPYGVFTEEVQSNNAKPSVFIAGGIGITPFVSHIMKSEDDSPWLFYANQTKTTAAFIGILKNVLKSRMIEVYDKESGGLKKNQEAGYLTAPLLEKYLKNPQAHNFYICGPPPMMTAVKKCLKQLEVPDEQVFSEEFGF